MEGYSCFNDWNSDSDTIFKEGLNDVWVGIKINFSKSFAMIMLSWSGIEYNIKYESGRELNHVKEVSIWGAGYFLSTFNSLAILWHR